ncbi:MAG: FtsW/RodA/SpoVE family cell cycle protein [Chloroflexota bacterium]
MPSRGWRPAVGRIFGDGPSTLLFLLAFLFTGLALLQLGLVEQDLRPRTFLPLLVLLLCGGLAACFLQARRPRPGEPLLLPLIYLLAGLGLALLARLAPAFIDRQLVWLVVSTVGLLLVTLVPQNLDWLRCYKYTWLSSGLLLLATTLVFGVNPSGYGARLWLKLGTIYFQPSEPLKLLLIVFLAGYMADRHRQLAGARAYIGRVAIPHPTYYGPMLLMWGFSIVLLVWQRDLGAALLFFGTFLGMLYAATGQARYIWAGALLLLVAGFIGYYLFDVVQLRIEAFLNPWLDPAGRSFQIVQSLLAFASGGVFGQGLGQGLPTAIPVVHTDFVFAAIGEEYGLLGSLAVLACFALLVGRAFHIALQAGRPFEQLLAAGIGTMLGLQTLAITAGTLKLMPLTGVTLPFVSYGGSSLVSSFMMAGILIFIANRQPAPARPDAPLAAFILRLGQGLLAGFLIVAGGLLLWHLVAAPFLLDRTDNPRLVIAEQRIDRGRLLTADGIPVAETILDPDGLAERHYPYPRLSSVTGYYSLRYGVGGTEAAFDPLLRGAANRSPEQAWLDDLLHRPPVGQDVLLTVNLPAQATADVALGKREGAVLVMEIDTGAILVMSSHPTYDPNQLDEMWDTLRKDEVAPLLNRATQGLFPLGDLARLVGLIGLAEAGATIPAEPLTAPLPELVAPLSNEGYLATAHQLGLTRPIRGLPSQPGLLPDFDDKGTVRDLAVTPLHLARLVAALESDGRLPAPILSPMADSRPSQAISPDTARRIRSVLPQIEPQLIGLMGQATPAETGRPTWLSWFVGLTPATTSPPAAAPSLLPFDPAQAPPAPAPTPDTEQPPARYVLVAVVVTEGPERDTAFRVASAPLRVIATPK